MRDTFLPDDAPREMKKRISSSSSRSRGEFRFFEKKGARCLGAGADAGAEHQRRSLRRAKHVGVHELPARLLALLRLRARVKGMTSAASRRRASASRQAAAASERETAFRGEGSRAGGGGPLPDARPPEYTYEAYRDATRRLPIVRRPPSPAPPPSPGVLSSSPSRRIGCGCSARCRGGCYG